MGDFYELFFDDATLASRVLGIALTTRTGGGESVPMAGVPYHSLETYLKKLIAAGHKVAVSRLGIFLASSLPTCSHRPMIAADPPPISADEFQRQNLWRIAELRKKIGVEKPGKRKKKYAPWRYIPVRCISTGDRFDSVSEAAEWLGECISAVSHAAHIPGRFCGGWLWEIDKEKLAARQAEKEWQRIKVASLWSQPYALGCVETGELFRNFKQAAARFGVHNQAVRRSAMDGRCVRPMGYRFVLLNQRLWRERRLGKRVRGRKRKEAAKR
jgi:hypothetical protein